MHPRCRCIIIYREIRTEPQKTPRITITNYEDVARTRSKEEFLTFANQIKPIVEKYTGRQSKWNGQLIFDDKESNSKLWDCSIRLNSNTPGHALIHELIHSCSVSHYGSSAYIKHRWEEELTVHYLSQELALLENFPVVDSGYDSGTALIREFRVALDMKKSDLEFAAELIKQPLGERFDWLGGLIPFNDTIEQYQSFVAKLETIKQWGPKKL